MREGEGAAAGQDDEQQDGANGGLSAHRRFLPLAILVQQTPGKPDVVGTAPGFWGLDAPFVGQLELPGRMLEGVGVGVVIAGAPLIPAFPISVEPIGTPVRLAPPIIEGEEEFVPMPLLVAAPPQGDVPLPDIAIPVPAPVPLIAPAGGTLGIPAPSKVPLGLDRPDVPDVGLPATEHGMVLLVVEPNDDAPLGIGLTPVVPSSVAPMGMPAGPTDRLPPGPSGDVGSIPGDGAGDVCAIAALPLRRTAAIVAISKCLTVGVSCYGRSECD